MLTIKNKRDMQRNQHQQSSWMINQNQLESCPLKGKMQQECKILKQA
jgi:hypothetical protein